jgi:hypothetical protein
MGCCSIGILAVSSGGMTAASQSMSAISAGAPMASRSAATTAIAFAPRPVDERNQRWCSDGFEIGCDNGMM